MNTNPSNRDLQVLLARIEERQIAIARNMDDFKANQKEHEIEDARQFESLNKHYNGMSKYYTAVGTVAGCIGSAIGFAIEYIVNRKS